MSTAFHVFHILPNYDPTLCDTVAQRTRKKRRFVDRETHAAGDGECALESRVPSHRRVCASQRFPRAKRALGKAEPPLGRARQKKNKTRGSLASTEACPL